MLCFSITNCSTILPTMASSLIFRHRTLNYTFPYPNFSRFQFTTTTDNCSSPINLPKLQPSPEADQISSLLLSHHNPFHSLESSLQLLHGISLSPPLLHQTLLRLHHSSKLSLSLFSSLLSLPNFIPDSSSLSLLIDSLSRSRQFDAAFQLLQTLTLTLTSSSPFLLLIKRLISAGLTRQAIRAFDDIPSFTESPTTNQDFIFLLDTLCKYSFVKLAMELFNKRKSQFDPCSKMYTILIYGWCKVNRIDMAERLLREMGEKGIEANVVTYNVILNGVCRRARLHPNERFGGVVRDADKVFEEMRERGIEPDVTSYSIVIHVYSRAHKVELTLEKFRAMKECGISPSIATYTSVVKCLASCGRMEEAEGMLGEMIENGVSPSSATYNCFLKEYGGRNDWEGAVSLYRRMRKSEDCAPSLSTHHILIGMFLKLNKMELVKEVWEDMKGSSCGPGLDSYTMFVHGLIEKRKWREACELFVEMIEKGILPQKVTFEMLYTGLIQDDKLKTWRRLQKRLEQESVSFGSEFEHLHLHPYKR